MILIPLMIIETIIVVILLGLLISAKTQISQLKRDNRELLRRLGLLSRSKIMD